LTIANLINKVSEYESEIKILNEGIGVEYTGDNRKLLSEIRDFKFTPLDTAIAELYEYYKENVDSLDVDAIKQDAYLDYAKSLNKLYFKS
jgi:GDP-L-fucose synthase